jgi:proteasome lid subunit RPN8/RPN11
MIRIEQAAWDVMVQHAESTYPNECCGAMLGMEISSGNAVTVAVPMENAFAGEQGARYEIRSEDLLTADAEARRQGLSLIGIYHSHPDADAYFSVTDLKNSCPWYSFLILSIRNGKFNHAGCFRPDLEQTHGEPEPLEHPQSSKISEAS